MKTFTVSSVDTMEAGVVEMAAGAVKSSVEALTTGLEEMAAFTEGIAP